MPKAPLNIWHKAGNLETVYSEFLEVRKCGNVTQRSCVEPVGSEPGMIEAFQANPQSPGKRKQAKLVWFFERLRPPATCGDSLRGVFVVGGDGVMEMGDGSHVPRVTGQGAR